MTRKSTVKIKDLVSEVNRIMKLEHSTREQRLSLQHFIGNLLHETGNYQGFNYLHAYELPANVKPGIIFDSVNHNHQYPDDSRVAIHFK